MFQTLPWIPPLSFLLAMCQPELWIPHTHTPAPSCVCLLIIARPHQRGTSAQCTCLPAKCGETTARGRREMSGATTTARPPPTHGLQKFRGASRLTRLPQEGSDDKGKHLHLCFPGMQGRPGSGKRVACTSCLVATCQEL